MNLPLQGRVQGALAEPALTVAAWRSRPDEIRVLGLEPVAALPAPIEAALPLRHDAR